jgi:hypothetical protein
MNLCCMLPSDSVAGIVLFHKTTFDCTPTSLFKYYLAIFLDPTPATRKLDPPVQFVGDHMGNEIFIMIRI